MQQLNKRLIFSLASFILVGGISLSGTAQAMHGEDDSNSGSDDSSVTSTKHGGDSEQEQENEVEVEHGVENEHHKSNLMEQFRMRGQVKLEETRQHVKEHHTQEQRQKACEARKNSLSNRMNRMVTRAQNHKDVFDKIYARVKQFHDDKNLNTPNYTELVAKVDTAQADAVDKIAALKSLDITVDCTQSNVAEKVSAFREALKSTRDSLKDYRKAIVALIVAIHDSNDNSSAE